MSGKMEALIVILGGGLTWLLTVRALPTANEAHPSAAGPALASLPISGLTVHDLFDSFEQTRGTNKHEAIDIMHPRGTPVHAVVDGVIAKLFLSKPGGNTIYLFDNDQVYCYYYAHLDHYADGLHEGQHVSHGEVIAFVGSTGNASPEAPHLHFTIFKLGPDKKWWKTTTPVNPYPILTEMLQPTP